MVLTGTIAAFTANGATIALAAPIYPDPSESPTTTVTLPGGPTLAASTTLLLTGSTLDGVPDGFGALRTGDSVLAIVDTHDGQSQQADPNIGVTCASVGGSVAPASVNAASGSVVIAIPVLDPRVVLSW